VLTTDGTSSSRTTEETSTNSKTETEESQNMRRSGADGLPELHVAPVTFSLKDGTGGTIGIAAPCLRRLKELTKSVATNAGKKMTVLPCLQYTIRRCATTRRHSRAAVLVRGRPSRCQVSATLDTAEQTCSRWKISQSLSVKATMGGKFYDKLYPHQLQTTSA
jgi:hypothetical protein